MTPPASTFAAQYLSVLAKTEVKPATSERLSLKINETQGIALVESLAKMGVLEIGTVSGLAYQQTRPRYRTEYVKDQACLPACWDGPEPEDTYSPQQVLDGYDPELHFASSSKRKLDISFKDGELTVLIECLDLEAMKKEALKKVMAEPENAMPFLVGKVEAKKLSDAFNKAADIGELKKQDALDAKKVAKYQKDTRNAMEAIKSAVTSSKLAEVLGAQQVSTLVKRKTGIELNFS